MAHPAGVVPVVHRLAGIPAILAAQRDQHLVEQRVPETGHLNPRAGLGTLVVGGVHDPHLAATRRTPYPEHRLGAHHVARNGVVRGQFADRDLDRDRVDVQRLGRIDAGSGGGRDQVQVLKRPQIPEVEDRPQVDEERVVALSGEDDLAAAERVHGGRAERRVVGRRARADVARRALQPGAENLGLLALDPCDREELALVPVGVAQRGDRARVVEEGVGVAQRRLEAKLVADLGQRVTVVVDVDRVQDVVAELEEVRAPGRQLQRHVVGDDRDGVGLVGADERVGVGVVGDGILADFGGFAMRRHLSSPCGVGAVSEPRRASAWRARGRDRSSHACPTSR